MCAKLVSREYGSSTTFVVLLLLALGDEDAGRGERCEPRLVLESVIYA
jgi:hypothetical protein